MTLVRRLLPKHLDPLFFATFSLLVFALLFGGATQRHTLRLAVIELAALPLLYYAARAQMAQSGQGAHREFLLILAALVLIPLFYLIPIPPDLWSSLPGRQEIGSSMEMTGAPERWLPISIAPDATWRAFLALLPPVAVAVATLHLRSSDIRRSAWLLLLASMLFICLATAQIASRNALLYPWSWTQVGSAVGMFANRNHFAIFCLATLPFAAVFGGNALRDVRATSRYGVWFAGLYALLVIVALSTSLSRAAVALLGPVASVSVLAAWLAAGRSRPPAWVLVFGAVAVTAVVAAGALSMGTVLARFAEAGRGDLRFEAWPLVARTADSFLPLGSGIGSFDALYRSVEPVSELGPTFLNQAHNDYLESWLETGWLGAALLAGFCWWFARRSLSAWRSRGRSQDLARAASIAIIVLLCHSAVDYPLRTTMIAVLFAFCCGVLERFSSPDQLERGRVRNRVVV